MEDISEVNAGYRYHFLYALGILIIGLLLTRSFYLQIVRGATFRSAAEGNRVAARLLTAPRGIIYDVRGEQLVENVASTDVILDPVYIPNPDYESILIEQLPQVITTISGSDVREALHRSRSTQRAVRIATAVDHDTVLEIERLRSRLPGVELASSLVRRYRNGRVTAPFLGYTGYVTGENLDTRPYVVGTDIIGKTGLEQIYDEELHGRHGVSYVEINAEGAAQKLIREEPPIAGADIHLSVDIALQQYITELLATLDEKRRKQGKRGLAGAVVALDPRTGGVRALVSYPSYDANVFSQPNLSDQTANILSDPRQLLFNRAVSGTYPPGSMIKPFIAAAALKENIISRDTTFVSTGGIVVGPWSFPDWKAGGHGVTDVHKAIAESVNTFFYRITGGDADRPGLGLARTRHYLAEFGWGSPTNIDTTNEAPGFLPDEKWKLSVKGEPWYIGDTYHLAIGQGDVLVTPLQIATSTAAIANGGSVYQPALGRALTRSEGEGETIERTARRVSISREDLKIVREGMRGTIEEGSGRALADMPVALAGKTGTAQVGGGDDTHAWFTSFGPFESPELVVTVLLEKGGSGDEDAVPVAKDIWQWWVEHRL